MAEKIRILLHHNDGGLLDEITSSSPNVEIIYVSADTENSEPEDIITTADGQDYHAHFLSVETLDTKIAFLNEVEKLIQERDNVTGPA